MTAVELSFAIYPLAVFTFMVFLLGLTGLVIFHLQLPQPRFIFAVKAEEPKEEKPSE